MAKPELEFCIMDRDRAERELAGDEPTLARSLSATMEVRGGLTPARVTALQRSIGNRRTTRMIARGDTGHRVLQRVPIKKALVFATKWLATRESKQVSGHIARHGRRIAGRVIHSVFRSPKDIKWMLDHTLKYASEVVARNAESDVIQEAGIKIERQSATRWAVNREFRSAIGTEGETVLRMIVNHNGRIVTAYPVRALVALGIVGSAAMVFDEKTAQAAEGWAAISQEAAIRQTEKDSSWFGDWEEWIPYLGDIYGGSLGENEDLYLKEDQLLLKTTQDVQAAAQQTWTPEAFQKAMALVRSAIAAPYYVEGDGDDGSSGLLERPVPDADPESADEAPSVPV
jgi:hypothetical protein